MDKSKSDFFIGVLSEEGGEANASIVMDELLRDPNSASEFVRKNLDSPNPVLRRRIHQLSSILNRRQLRKDFQGMVECEDSTNWLVCCIINVILDPQASVFQLNDLLRKIIKDNIRKINSTQEFQQIIRMIGLNPETSGELYLNQFLLSDSLVSYTGHPLLMAVIAQHIGELCGWKTTLGLLNDVPCLRDSNSYVLSATSSWDLSHPAEEDFHPINKMQLAGELLANISTAAYLDQIASIYVEAQALLDQCMPEDL